MPFKINITIITKKDGTKVPNPPPIVSKPSFPPTIPIKLPKPFGNLPSLLPPPPPSGNSGVKTAPVIVNTQPALKINNVPVGVRNGSRSIAIQSYLNGVTSRIKIQPQTPLQLLG